MNSGFTKQYCSNKFSLTYTYQLKLVAINEWTCTAILHSRQYVPVTGTTATTIAIEITHRFGVKLKLANYAYNFQLVVTLEEFNTMMNDDCVNVVSFRNPEKYRTL